MQRPSHFGRIASLEPNVPKPVGDPKSSIHALRAMVIEVMTPRVTEVNVSGRIEMDRVMDPLRQDVSLYIAGENDRQGIDGSNKAQRCTNDEERQEIAQASIDVLSIQRIVVMAVVNLIKKLKKVMLDPRSVYELIVKHPPMGDVLHKGV